MSVAEENLARLENDLRDSFGSEMWAERARAEWDSGSMHVTRHAIGANQDSGRFPLLSADETPSRWVG